MASNNFEDDIKKERNIHRRFGGMPHLLGRDSFIEYDPSLAHEGDDMRANVLMRIARGESLIMIEKLAGYPSIGEVLRWVQEDPDYEYRYYKARESAADIRVDEMVYIADNVEENMASIAKAKLMIDTRRHLAGKWLNRIYGEKAQQLPQAPQETQDAIPLQELNKRLQFALTAVQAKEDAVIQREAAPAVRPPEGSY
jgi:hypothetical protein